ncbi:type III-A CRISPR-associated RAMP protein Csm3 [Desulfococcaceae bacterium HSG8]|nr:type III-A CRISPR-associated RAMP protein Csm3 [Desulfococcaceae bacterium HSG8]
MANKQIKLLGFVKTGGTIEVLTGLHIGGTSDSIDKGGIDSPVIKNPVTNEPYIPGSSLRGRMRSLLEKKTGAKLIKMTNDIWLEMYDKDNYDDEAYKFALKSQVCRVFGNSASDPGVPSVLVVRDAMLSKESKKLYMQSDLPVTEAKIEIVVDRITAHAMPRTIERMPAGAKFDFEIVYKVQTYENGEFAENAADNPETKCDHKLRQDLENIFCALGIIQEHTGLGGNTSRGHGQVRFNITQFDAKTVDGDAAEGFKLPEKKPYSFSDCKEAIKTISFSQYA